MNELLFDVGIVIVMATALAFLARFVRQPMIIAFLAAGIIIGPSGLKLVTDQNAIFAMSEFGIAFLLFIVGLELDLRKLRELGKPTVFATFTQVILSFAAGFAVAKLFLFSNMTALYLGIACSFASTTVVLKLLTEKLEMYSVHGRMQLGILIIQDVIAVVALALLTTLDNFSLQTLGMTIVKGFLLFAIAFAAGRFIFPILFGNAAKNQDLLFLAAVSLSFLMSYAALQLGFSIAMGAFLAGISIASLPYSYEIVGKTKSLRDFFATIFFVSLGMQISFSQITSINPILAFLGIVLILSPMIVTFVIALFGYGKKISFMSGIGLSQMSEFALVIAAQGLLLNHITKDAVSLIAVVTVISITISTYFIKYNHHIFAFFSNKLRFLDRFKRKDIDDFGSVQKYDFVLLGYDRIGYSVLNAMKKMKSSFIVIDYNPDVIKKLTKEKIPCVYGDVNDSEILEKVHISDAKLIVSTIPNRNENLFLIKKLRHINKKSLLIVTARNIDDALQFYELGADYVILPYFLGGDYASLLLETFTEDFAKILYHKVYHIGQLKKRKEAGHEHMKAEF